MLILSTVLGQYVDFYRNWPWSGGIHLKTFGEFADVLWKTFKYLSRNCQRVDILFDLYIINSVKEGERDRRKKADAIDFDITSNNQPLPVKTESFWAASKNKEKLQIFFINWLSNIYKEGKPIHLGGSLPGNLTGCSRIVPGVQTSCRLLRCDHEEPDDRLMFHINHAVRVENFTKVIIAATDTDIFVSALHHFAQWMHDDLDEIWMLCGQGLSSRAVPLHDIVNGILDSSVIDVLPAAHALTGCDTTSKISTKKAAMKIF